MRNLLVIGSAGALGALARTIIGLLTPETSGFPVGTFVANITGAFILCFLVEKTLHWTLMNNTIIDAITAGFLGSFTSFSAFSFEGITLLQTQTEMGIFYIFVSLLSGLFVGALGIRLARREQTS